MGISLFQVTARATSVTKLAPLELNVTQGVYKETKLQVKIPYVSALVRVKFALRNAFIDDYSVDMNPCPLTPTLQAITSK